MTEQNQTSDHQPTPSQAEGEATPGTQPAPKSTPSQAEGELEIVAGDQDDQGQR